MNAIADIQTCSYSGCRNLAAGGFSRCDLHLTRDALRYATNPEYRERQKARAKARYWAQHKRSPGQLAKARILRDIQKIDRNIAALQAARLKLCEGLTWEKDETV